MKTMLVLIAALGLAASPALAEHNNGNDGVIPPPFQDGWSPPGQGGDGGAGGGGGAGGAGGDATATSSSSSSSTAVGVGSAEATVNGGHMSVRSSNDVDAEPAYAPDVNVHPTIVCALAQGGSAGAGGVFAFGLGVSYTEEDCVMREWTRLALDGGDEATQKMANDLVRARLQEYFPASESTPQTGAMSTSSAGSPALACGYDDPNDLITYDWC